MKKLAVYIMTGLLLLTFIPNQLKAGVAINLSAIDSTKSSESPALKVLLVRLHEIKVIDKSTLNSNTKKQLKKEVRSIKKQIRELRGGGIYLSIGALLIVILLLILLL